jgi:hypothetical protein
MCRRQVEDAERRELLQRDVDGRPMHAQMEDDARAQVRRTAMLMPFTATQCIGLNHKLDLGVCNPMLESGLYIPEVGFYISRGWPGLASPHPLWLQGHFPPGLPQIFTPTPTIGQSPQVPNLSLA